MSATRRTPPRAAFTPRASGAGRPRKLTDNQVDALTKDHAEGSTVRELAEKYRVAKATVRRYLKMDGHMGNNTRPRVLTDEQAAQVRKAFDEGTTPLQLAERHGVSIATMRRALGLALDTTTYQ